MKKSTLRLRIATIAIPIIGILLVLGFLVDSARIAIAPTISDADPRILLTGGLGGMFLICFAICMFAMRHRDR